MQDLQAHTTAPDFVVVVVVFNMGARNPNPGLHAYVASPILAEPSHQYLELMFL